MNTDTTLSATEARNYAKQIAVECSECYPAGKVKARKFLGQWVIYINGGSGACYGNTLRSVEDAENTIRIFKN